MARKKFTTSIDETIQLDFKNACKRQKLDMNEVLEPFMKSFSNGDFDVSKEISINLKNKKN